MFNTIKNVGSLVIRWLFYFFLGVTIFLPLSITSIEASQFSTSIKVNNISISKYEVNERRKLLLALGTEKASAKALAKENLVNEALQSLHASAMNITVGKGQLGEVYNNFLEVRSMTQNELKKSLQKYGSSIEELKAYLKANVLMRNIVSRTYHSRMTQDDFDFTLFRPAASITIPAQISLSEIIIPMSIRGKDNTIKLGERISNDLIAGKDFESLAKRFSRASTAKLGGLIGFVSINSIPQGLREILVKLKAGSVSNPIVTNDTIMIFKVNSWKTSESARKLPTEVSYAIIKKNTKAPNTCESLDSEQLQGPKRETSLEQPLRDKIKFLRPSERATFTDSNGLQKIILLCDRRIILSKNEIKILKGQMLEKRLSKLAEGLTLELKRTAKIRYMK
ncbi:MAG: hypothetical protein CML39_02120 [Rhodobacteraceae bacterium]|nr:MAG: hypothetical protein CML39_02120 [Paracoccaceae bacterium]